MLANREQQLQLAMLDDVQSSGTLKTNREARGWRVRHDSIAVQSNVCEQIREQVALPITRNEAKPVACWAHSCDGGTRSSAVSRTSAELEAMPRVAPGVLIGRSARDSGGIRHSI